jgi:hypothetical protein
VTRCNTPPSSYGGSGFAADSAPPSSPKPFLERGGLPPLFQGEACLAASPPLLRAPLTPMALSFVSS